MLNESLLGWALVIVLLLPPLLLPVAQLDAIGPVLPLMALTISVAWAWRRVGVLSAGHGVFYVIGAVAMKLALAETGACGWGARAGAMMLATVLAAGLAVAVAWVMARLLMRDLPGRRSPGVSDRIMGGPWKTDCRWIVGTLLLSMVVERALAAWLETHGPTALTAVLPVPAESSLARAVLYCGVLGILLIMVVGLLSRRHCAGGLRLAAACMRPLRAAASGIDVGATRRRALVSSAVLAAVAGAAHGCLAPGVAASLAGPALAIEVLVWVMVGGRQSEVAAAAGCALMLLPAALLGFDVTRPVGMDPSWHMVGIAPGAADGGADRLSDAIGAMSGPWMSWVARAWPTVCAVVALAVAVSGGRGIAGVFVAARATPPASPIDTVEEGAIGVASGTGQSATGAITVVADALEPMPPRGYDGR